jgi:hypothetical protein
MGITTKVAGRVAKFFSQDKERVNQQIAKGSTNNKLDGSALDIVTLGYDALAEYLRLEQDILSRYADYEEMDEYGEIATALDILADDATIPDTTINRTVWITSKDKTLQQNLDDLINKRLRLDEEIWEIARTLCKYGNDYEEILANEQGVLGLNYLPAPTVRRIEGNKGDLLGFLQDFRGKFDFSVSDYNEILSQKFGGSPQGDAEITQRPTSAFEAWEVAHFRLRGKERRSVYGHSALEGARWIWKRLMLLEDAALVYRLQRAPERFAFYVDTGDLPPNESLAYVNRVRQNFRKKKYVDPTSGKLNLKFDSLAPDEDFFIPTRKGVDSTRIENLGSPQWQAMDDIEYFRDKLFAAIKVPKAYLGQEAGVARAVLSSEDVRFARTVLRIQRELKNGLRKIVRVHLSALNIDPYSVEYDINMTVPSSIFELAQMEVRTAKADLAGRMRDFVSLQWILTNVFGMSDAEIKELQGQRKKETMQDAELQGDAMAVSQPAFGTEYEGGATPEPELPPEDQQEPEGEYGPPPEERRIISKQDPIMERVTRLRTQAHRRGIRTSATITDQELFEGRNKRNEAHLDEKLAQLLQNDKGMELRLRELGGLLRELRGSVRRR